MKEIETDDAPASIGPYSQGILDGDRIYVSGQGPVNPESGEVISEDIAEQTAQTIENIEAILAAEEKSLDDVTKSTVFVRDMDNYEEINEVYEEYFSSPYPARSAVEVVRLPIDIGVEIEVVATA
ncbi:Rid family detoxifying hydrolase [Natronococcus wangiae]|uniref:Rid family detoxifying hydrolase n=1 Tax=Natronococcus wangiae TaxID=3068275 RepID=UPI00273DC098|nr:Rid family detoxifying hydrolase [Natronococcus sp. AD5]